MKKILQALMILGVLSAIYYLAWWFEQGRIYRLDLFVLFMLAVIYTVAQVFSAWYIFLHAKHVPSREAPAGLSVDVLVPTYDEPLWLVEHMLAAIAIRYPHQTYLIDDGRKQEYRELAERLGAHYISRPTNADNKAGNVNCALARTHSEFVAIFDIDHVPQPDYLDRSLGHFDDPHIGFVQVMLSHCNDAESFVAGAASQRNNGFFGAPMLGLNGMGGAQAFGSNCIFRRQALASINGYKPGLKVYPLLAMRLTPAQNIGYLWHLSCYLAGPMVAANILAAILVLFWNAPNVTAAFADYLLHGAPFAFMGGLIGYVADKKYYTASHSPKCIPFGGLFLAYGTWPIYTLAFFCELFGIDLPFIATPKETKGGNFVKLVIPQIITVMLLVVAVLLRLSRHFDLPLLWISAFAAMHVFMHSGVFYAVWEGWRIQGVDHLVKKMIPSKRIYLE